MIASCLEGVDLNPILLEEVIGSEPVEELEEFQVEDADSANKLKIGSQFDPKLKDDL